MTKQPSGIFLVNKPSGITTNHLIQQVKKQLKVQKIGHAGTLDPLATGLVVVLVNGGTKLSDLFLNQTKAYQVQAQLYVHTTSFDLDGEIVTVDHDRKVQLQDLERVNAKYNGYSYEQTPPIYSAIKVEGKKLYQYARDGRVDVQVPSRQVQIYESKLLAFDPETATFSLRVVVSKGTYIRSLIVDYTADLQTLAHVTALERLQSGVFKLAQAKTLNALTWADLIPNYQAVLMNDHPVHELNEQQFFQVANGRKIKLSLGDKQVFLSYHQELIALYELEEASGLYKSVKGGFSQ